MLDLKKAQMVFAENLKALRKEEHYSHATLAEEINKRYKGKTLLAEREGKKRKSITSKDSLISYEVADEYHSRYPANLGMSVETLLLFSDFYRVSADYLLGLSEIPFLKDDEARAIHYDIGLNEEAIKYLRTLREWNAKRTPFFEWLSEGAREDTGKPLDDAYMQRLLDPRLALLSELVERIGKKDSDGNNAFDDLLTYAARYIKLVNIEEPDEKEYRDKYMKESSRLEGEGLALVRPSEQAQMILNGKLLESLKKILDGIAADRKAAAKDIDGKEAPNGEHQTD